MANYLDGVDGGKHNSDDCIGSFSKWIYEYCPCCDSEVRLENKFIKHSCPYCGSALLPCSICDEYNCNNCVL